MLQSLNLGYQEAQNVLAVKVPVKFKLLINKQILKLIHLMIAYLFIFLL